MQTYNITITMPGMTYRESVTSVNPIVALAIIANRFAAGVLNNATSVVCEVA